MRVIIFFVTGLFFATAHAPSLAQTDPALSIRTADSGRAVEEAQLERVLAAQPIIARLARERRLSFFNADIIAQSRRADVVLRATPAFLVAAVLDGRIRAAGKSAGPGDVIYWPAGEAAREGAFDAAVLAATAEVGLGSEDRRNLERIARKQERLKFWGLLRPTALNFFAPYGDIALQRLRNGYLARPEILRLIRGNRAPHELAAATARRFAGAVAAGESATVEALLSPALFMRQGETTLSPRWRLLRAAFAERLVASGLADGAGGALDARRIEDGLWRVDAGTASYRVALEAIDMMYFVTAMEREG